MSKCKVMLIQPPYTLPHKKQKSLVPPMGMCYLAAVLEQDGAEVAILDCYEEGYSQENEDGPDRIRCGLGDEEIERRIREFAPDFVGVSILFSLAAKNAYRVCQLAKRVSDDIRVAVGGHHPSFLAQRILQEHECIDFVVLGEGEYALRDLARKHRTNNSDFSDIDGLVYRDAGPIRVNPKTSWIKNLDEIPFPARRLCDMERYFAVNLPQSGRAGRGRISRSLPVLSSRGCPRNCIFCGTVHLWGRQYRARSPENFVAEIESLKRTYDLEEFQVQDDNFTVNRPRVMKILDLLIEKKLDMQWCTPQGTDVMTLDRDMIAKMKQSGCREITLAIESGDESVNRDIIGKPIKLERVRDVVRWLKEFKILAQGFFMIGLPGETKKSIAKTIEFADSLDLDRAQLFIATPLPGTKLHDLALHKGYIVSGFDFDNVNSYGRGCLRTEEFTPEYLEELQFKFTRKSLLRSVRKHPLSYGWSYMTNLAQSPRMILNLFHSRS
jgi:anaerobic magnesium-protoporphyrin IX monomethyl ester cyclase